MQADSKFSLKRFIMLFRQSLIVNRKFIGISLAGVSGSLFLFLIMVQSMSGFNKWDLGNYMATFIFVFFFLGILYISYSFPGFRSKEKSITYLMLPASNSEKYFHELIVRIIAYILFMPLIFWIVANLEGAIVHHYVPKLINFKFSFGQATTEFLNEKKPNSWDIMVFVQVCLFFLVAAFTGATHFSKSPLVKTLFTFSVIMCGYLLLIYLFYKGLDIKEYHTLNGRILFLSKGKDLIIFFAIAGTLVNLSLLAISWFRLKEKEV
jgi:hypothetical protein